MRPLASGAAVFLLALCLLLPWPETRWAGAFAPSPPGDAWQGGALLSQVAPLPQEAPLLLRLRMDRTRAGIGETVTVDLLLENVVPLFGADLALTYDPNLLSVEEVLPGPLFPEGQRYVMPFDPHGTPGRVRYLSTLLGDAVCPASTGVLASIRFRTRAAGPAHIQWDDAAVKLSDRGSNPLAWTPEDATLEVAAPTSTPGPNNPPSSGGGGAAPEPAHTPRPTSTPRPTHVPTATRTPTPTRTPRLAGAAPMTIRLLETAGTPAADSYLPFATGSNRGADYGGALFPEPTLGPTVGVTLPEELPPGIPPTAGEGVVAFLEPVPGVGVVRTSLGGSPAEFRVDNQGFPLAVRVQFREIAPDVVLPAGTGIARAFSLDLYSLDAGSNTARRVVYSDGRTSAPIVLKWRLGEAEFDLTRDQAGVPHPGRLVFYQISPEGYLVKIQTTWSPDPAPYGTLTAVFVDRSTFLLAVLPPEQEGQTVPADHRYSPQTGYRVNLDRFWDYFNKRGGVNSFGYPISREFTLKGFPVQLFQRGVLQAMPDGGVATMNLLDSGLMPYTRINSSTFPAADPELVASAPQPAEPDYAGRAIAFVRENVPDRWEGLPVGFRGAYFSRVHFEDAFPDGRGEAALVPLLNLEMWGLPTSKPAYDPANHNFVYQRFQRGILHYDATTGSTQGLLLGDYLKSLMTGQNLPPDLDLEARDSPFYHQYDRSRPGHVGRWWELEGTDLVGAFDMDVPQEVVSAGH